MESLTKTERVKENTFDHKNTEIDQQIISNLRTYNGKSNKEISERINQLDKEWDIERVLSLNMASLALIGIILTLFVNIYWIFLPFILLLFYLQHAIQGWCPPIIIFRKFKIRTRQEIDREKYALKALRGDFYGLQSHITPEFAFEITRRK